MLRARRAVAVLVLAIPIPFTGHAAQGDITMPVVA
jgi:hypothetical protein